MLNQAREAPAKINLNLYVTERRADGYHEIDSIFLPLTLADHVHLSIDLNKPTEVICICPGHPELDGPSNLAAQAALAYLTAAEQQARVQITIRKKIWSAAGLGGGSSDAATSLLALQALLGIIPRDRLFQLARRLGADVPFFLNPKPQRARGIGEMLTPISGLPRLDLVLVNPQSALSTASVYAGLGLALGARTASVPIEFPEVEEVLSLDTILSLLHNDLATPAERLCPSIATMKHELITRGALAASMTGSGPTVFGIFSNSLLAQQAAEAISSTTAFSALATSTRGYPPI